MQRPALTAAALPGARPIATLAIGFLCACGPSVEGECLSTTVGEPMPDVVARLDRTGATHTPSRATASGLDEHRWLKMQATTLAAMSCYVVFDARGTVVSFRYHEGN